MRSCLSAVLAVLLLTTFAATPPAAQSRQTRADQTYTSAATAILVDVVVRDRKGRPVTDLSASDFELLEDGVVQKVDSFTRVSRGGGIGLAVGWKSPATTVAVTTSPDSAAAGDGTDEGDATVALVFDHLSAESLRLAQRATLEYVPMNGESAARVGVFATDPGIRTVLAYTTDRTRVRNAVSRIPPAGTSAEEQKIQRTDQLTARRSELRAQNTNANASLGGSGGGGVARAAAEIGERETELRMVQAELNMLRAFDNLDRDHKGFDTSMALLKVVRSLAQYPGRKTIVFFSEGLPVSPTLSAKLDRVIDAANRANVTAYAVDAMGLRTKSSLAEMRKEIDGFAEERRFQTETGSEGTEQPLTMAFERVEDTLKLDSRTGLARLAADTGGFLIEQSNDLSSAFRRIDEDNRFHYLLTYSPKNTDFDGKFRAIAVKVRRPGTQVFARKGYRAIRAPASVDAASFDGPALALLDRTPLPNAFPIHAAGFSFPDPRRPGLTPVVVHVNTNALQFDIDSRRPTYSAQTAIVVRIRDQRGREVEKLSQEYLLTGDVDDVHAARKGEILFYRELDLDPGVYTMESIVFDANSQQGSARMATLTIPAVDAGALAMSSVVLVNRVEEVAENPPPTAPLYVGRTLLYPNLGEPIGKSAAGELPFHFTVYGNTRPVKATAQLLRSGQPIAEAPIELAAARDGRIQHVGRLPLATLTAGTYELRIAVTDGAGVVSRTAFFTLTD